jgi:hypothetical protein
MELPLPILFAPIVLLIVGWFCLKRPTIVVRYLSSHVTPKATETNLTKGQVIAKYVRENPDQWPIKYPDLFRLIQLMGIVSYLMFVGFIAIILLKWIVQ